ncbi:hypothetical protein K432DRAFT_444209 [Lepidopterella palustris CBS 459.81]|uniref:Atos-like C-terminal domain-containing protein n=1 Tax=Lepidopterella palustris CBS 459.81 TaxID=1314670 RepID=A0A8E2JDY6_9PEZI|nr:hypothetical protein K432DRAFT_444209 [Lepidopterella palustris CBS 459.81]
MPIFHDPYDLPPRKLSPELDNTYNTQLRRPDIPEASFAGGLPGNLHLENAKSTLPRSDVIAASGNAGRPSTLSRVELIERIKRSNSPSWSPHQNNGERVEGIPETPTRAREKSTTPLLPAAEFRESRTSTPDPLLQDYASAGPQIERPKSALHSGDFRQEKDTAKFNDGSNNIPLATSPVAPWHHSFPAAAFGSARRESQLSFREAVKHDDGTVCFWDSRWSKRFISSKYQELPIPGSPATTFFDMSEPNTAKFYTSNSGFRAVQTLDFFRGLPLTPCTDGWILRRINSAWKNVNYSVSALELCHPDRGFGERAIGNGRIADNSPSPYVGLIDLENSLPPPDENGEGARKRRRHTVTNPDHYELDFRPSPRDDPPAPNSKTELRKKEKMKRRTTWPKAPPGGSYRIPQQGQLQIVIKNPNKTAVKLFLVPYDLSDMEAGQKTFIRQRSYSAGPIIDMPLASRTNLGTDRPEAALSSSDDPNNRPVLRYLIHLHICCPSKGRYFLYKGIRVVFANRVPDGKEKLRNEIQLPEPRYSAYKPSRDSTAQHATSAAAAQLTAEKAFRRRSAGFSLAHHAYDRVDGIGAQPPLPSPAYQFTGGGTSISTGYGGLPTPMGPIPFSITRLAAIDSRPVSRDPMDLDPQSPFRSRENTITNSDSMGSPTSLMSGIASPVEASFETYDKLSRGDVGYGGNAFCGVGGPAAPGAGLLARRLKGLDVQKDWEEK